MPNKNELTLGVMSFLKKKTNEEPNVVIKNIIEKPIIVNNVSLICVVYLDYNNVFCVFYLVNSDITIDKLLANNFTAKARSMTPKNLRKMKMMSLPNHFSIFPTKRITIYAKIKFKTNPAMMLMTE